MFEQSVVESALRQPSSRRAITLPISIAMHFVAVSGALFAAVWNVEFPLQAPTQLEELTTVIKPEFPQGRRTQQKTEESKPATTVKPNSTPTIVPDKPLQPIPASISSTLPTITDATGTTLNEGGVDPNGTDDGDPFVVSAEPSNEEPRQLHRAGGDVKPPVIVTRFSPDYPPMAVRMRIEGMAIVECIIDREGNIRSVKSIFSSDDLFRAAAEESVAKWKFRPGTLNGQPVDVVFNLTVTFKLN